MLRKAETKGVPLLYRNAAMSRVKYCALPLLAAVILCLHGFSVPCFAAGKGEREERMETEENKVYDRLKQRLERGFDEGMGQIEGAGVIEVTGDLPERFLRGIANGLARNLKSIKAGSLIAGMVSFVTGAVLAMLVKKDKKIRKRAIGMGMLAIPGLLLIVVFGVSWYVSIFR